MIDKLPLMLNVLFGILIAASLVLLFSGRPGMPLPGTDVESKTMQHRAAVPVEPKREIAGYHLFGQAEASRPEVRRAPTVAPDTRLKLTLSGVLAASEEQHAAHAIIAGPDGNEQSYRIDDRLPGGAVIKEIYPDRVILSRSGKYETLRLPHNRLKLQNQNN